MADWIERVRIEREAGQNRPLTQSQHEAVNARHPGLTLEICCVCDEPTGRGGLADDSLFTDDGDGPYCERCWEGVEHG